MSNKKQKSFEKPIISRTKRMTRNTIRSIPFTKTTYKLINSRSSRLSKFFSHSYSVSFEENSILLMPHGGVWESDINSIRVLELKKEKNLKVVPIVYDLCPILTPQFCSDGIRKVFKKYMERVLPNADLILAISNNTAEDVRSWLDVVQKRKVLPPVSVIRLGDEIADDLSPKKPIIKLPKKFIACIGTIEVRKNHTALYYAYKLAASKKIDLPPVLVVGRKGWHTKDIYEIISKDPGTRDKFIFLHDASDNELAWIYQNALFSVYPSFYEGWGLPVAESLLRGLPCIASDTSSIPEIGGDLVEYFSPYSPSAIMEKIKTFSDETVFLKRRKKQIKEEYKPVSWDTTFTQIEKLLKKL